MIINSTEFINKLNYLGMGVAKNIADKPIYNLVLFETDNGIVYGYTSNGKNSIKVEIGPTADDFYALVDYVSLLKFVKYCDGDIELTTTPKFIQIKSSNIKGKLPNGASGVPKGKSGITFEALNEYPNTLGGEINLSMIKTLLNPTHPVEIYQYVYFGDAILVTDTDNVLCISNKIFDRDLLLDIDSVQILSSVSNISYSYVSTNNILKLAIKSDEVYAELAIRNDADGDFQYDDLMNLFTDYNGDYTQINISELSKAMDAASMFGANPILAFNKDGIFIKIEASDFTYKLSDQSCTNHSYIISKDIVKKLGVIGKTCNIYYTNEGLIKCETDQFKVIVSAEDSSND